MTSVFAGGSLREFLEKARSVAKTEIDREERERFLNLNESDYVNYLVQKHRIEPISFDVDNLTVSESEQMVSAESYPRHFSVVRGKSYSRQVVTFHLPYSGFDDLLHLSPSNRILWTEYVQVNNGEITFSFIVFDQGPEGINSQKTKFLSNLVGQAANTRREVEEYNRDLESFVSKAIQDRKKKLLEQSSLLAGLGIPVRKKAGSPPQTFSIPSVKNNVVIKKPQAPSTPYSPDPALSDDLYKAILKICYDFGIQIERTPSLYKGKDEETLRDHLLLVLAPHFEFAAGETFNKSGKTDILVRYEGKNAFVGECKFWRGDKAHADTIDKILGYLTWRDSKAAILYFVDNKQLDPVLKKIQELSPNHRCFVKALKPTEEAWMNYEFRLPSDETRGIKLAILVFHFPSD